MSRFFKSAAFPILIVVVLAFLEVRLVNPGLLIRRWRSYRRSSARSCRAAKCARSN